jgi:molecular chaperone DnaK
VLGGDVKDILLLDVTPLTLSIETLGGVATPQIERNTTIPTRKSQVFSTASDSQTQVEIHVLQGERPMALDNKSLGKFILDGIPPAPRGIPQIEVTFDIDANGILKVTAADKASGRSQHITITASSGLAKDEVERMRKEAEAHAADDKKRRDLIEAKNTADNSIYGAEKVLSDLGDKVPAEIKAEVQAAVAEVKKLKDGEDEQAIRKAVDALSQVVQRVGAAAYQAKPSDGPEQKPVDDNVVDGEVKE